MAETKTETKETKETKAASKHYVVLFGVVSLPDAESVYKNDVVPAERFGDQLERHLKSGAIRVASTYEAKAGIANPTGEPSLEDQIDEATAQQEALEERKESLKVAIAERDARLEHQQKKAAEAAKTTKK